MEGNTRILRLLNEQGYEIVAKLGQGGCGVCYKVYSNKYRDYFACKIMFLREEKKVMQEKCFNAEMGALGSVTHPNIIKIFDKFTSDDVLIIIMEYCPNGDLQKVIQMHGPIPQPELLYYATRLLDALKFLEQKQISHNDIKPSNIFLDQYGRPKLADFGLAKKCKDLNELSNDFTGSPAFLAPEILNRKPYNPFQADIWSFGMTLYYLLTGKFPFSNNSLQGLYDFIKTGYFELPPDTNPILKYLIDKTLVLEPSKRMSYSDLSRYLFQHSISSQNITAPLSLPPLIQSKSTTINKLSHSKRSMRLSYHGRSSFSLLIP